MPWDPSTKRPAFWPGPDPPEASEAFAFSPPPDLTGIHRRRRVSPTRSIRIITGTGQEIVVTLSGPLGEAPRPMWSRPAPAIAMSQGSPGSRLMGAMSLCDIDTDFLPVRNRMEPVASGEETPGLRLPGASVKQLVSAISARFDEPSDARTSPKRAPAAVAGVRPAETKDTVPQADPFAPRLRERSA
jgi:hypothetical protein